jgi:hypothetical protein
MKGNEKHMRGLSTLTAAMLSFTGFAGFGYSNETNTSLSFSPDASSIEAFPTARTRVYSLLESTNLTENNWVQTQSLRGTESNLVFEITKDAPQKFFKVDSSYEPVEPASFFHTIYGNGTQKVFAREFYDTLVNYQTNSLQVNVTWVEAENPDHQPTLTCSATNMPFTQTLTNGINIIHSSLTCNDFYGLTYSGTVTITPAE